MRYNWGHVAADKASAEAAVDASTLPDVAKEMIKAAVDKYEGTSTMLELRCNGDDEGEEPKFAAWVYGA